MAHEGLFDGGWRGGLGGGWWWACRDGHLQRLVAQDEECNKAWANVESVLQRRFDLIPNLVNTVKGYAAHEKGTLEEITRLRSQWGEANAQQERSAWPRCWKARWAG
jgi:hypothetical protein